MGILKPDSSPDCSLTTGLAVWAEEAATEEGQIGNFGPCSVSNANRLLPAETAGLAFAALGFVCEGVCSLSASTSSVDDSTAVWPWAEQEMSTGGRLQKIWHVPPFSGSKNKQDASSLLPRFRWLQA